VSASVNLPLHYKVQKFSSGTGSPGWSRKNGRKMVVVVLWYTAVVVLSGNDALSQMTSCGFSVRPPGPHNRVFLHHVINRPTRRDELMWDNDSRKQCSEQIFLLVYRAALHCCRTPHHRELSCRCDCQTQWTENQMRMQLSMHQLHTELHPDNTDSWLGDPVVGLATQWSLVRFPAGATNTGIRDYLRMGKLP